MHHTGTFFVLNKTSVDIRNDTLVFTLADTTDLYIPRDDDEIFSLFQKRIFNVQFSVVKFHSPLHPLVSSFHIEADPSLVDHFFLRERGENRFGMPSNHV